MYIPNHYRESDEEEIYTLIRAFPLGMVISHGKNGIQTSLLPFVLYTDESDKGVLRAHFARANPHWLELEEADECLIVFQGENGYISPSWYTSKAEHHRVVPTWNFAVVEVKGAPKIVQDGHWLKRMLGDLTYCQEQFRPTPWSIDDAPSEYIDMHMRGIVGIEIDIRQIDGKWKMSQDKLEKDRVSVIQGLRGAEDPHGSQTMADIVESKHKAL